MADVTKEDKKSFMDFVLHHWVALAALVAFSTAWGQQQVKVQNLEQAITLNKDHTIKLDELKTQVIRQEEQLKAIKESQAKSEIYLEKLLEMKLDEKENKVLRKQNGK
jgi:hypothetical protein